MDHNELPDNSGAEVKRGLLVRIGQELIGGVEVELEARLGTAVMTVDQLMSLKSGSVITLETGLADTAKLYLNNALVARGEIVAVGDRFGLRIVEVASEG